MNFKLLGLTFFIFVFSAPSFSQGIDLSSVDCFYRVSEKINLGNEISDSEWNELFESSGYKVSATSELRKSIIKEIMLIAFDQKKVKERDSILQYDIVANLNNKKLLLSSLTLLNYMEMQKNSKDLKQFRENYDFNGLKQLSTERLKSFLPAPIDSLIKYPSINLLCYEPDAQSKSAGIVIDYNLFYKKRNGGNVDFIAHEMFHTYRSHFENEKYIKTNNFTYQLDKLQNEGIADLIDKNTDVHKHFENLNIPDEIVKMYLNTFNKTPSILKEFEQITLAFLNKEIDEATFNKKLKHLFPFGCHPNSFYMTSLIVKAGLKDQLLENFYNPHMYLVLYNKAAKQFNEYVFSAEFMDYSNQVAKEYYH